MKKDNTNNDIDKKEDGESPVVVNCEDQLQQIKAEAEDYKSKWLRAHADYQNLTKETDKRKAEMFEWCERSVIEEFLGVYDNFKKALSTNMGDTNNTNMSVEEKKLDNWKQGIEFIKKQFGDILNRHGVEEIKTVGEKFNPEFHEAVGEEAGEGDSGEIVREVDGGYLMKGKVVKVARVVIRK